MPFSAAVVDEFAVVLSVVDGFEPDDSSFEGAIVVDFEEALSPPVVAGFTSHPIARTTPMSTVAHARPLYPQQGIVIAPFRRSLKKWSNRVRKMFLTNAAMHL